MTKMKVNRKLRYSIIIIHAMVVLAVASSRLQADVGTCGGVTINLPFTDVGGSIFFCQIAEAYLSGLTNGTSGTTYSPSNPVTREQMAAFMTRAMDQSLRRGSRRAALGQWWTDQTGNGSNVGNMAQGVQSDGADLWVANNGDGTVSRVRSSDGAVLGTWTGATGASSVLVAGGVIFVTGYSANKLYTINPWEAPGQLGGIVVGEKPSGLTYDGRRVWTANNGGSVSIIDWQHTLVTDTVSTGFSEPGGILFDGTNIWVADFGDNKLKKLDSNGNILSSVKVGITPYFPVFDGTNIWVPNHGDNSVSVVRAKDSAGNPLASPFLLSTLTGNGLINPVQAAFDGQRVLVTNQCGVCIFSPTAASLWKAADLTPLGQVSGGFNGYSQWGACSDGVKFWVVLQGPFQGSQSILIGL